MHYTTKFPYIAQRASDPNQRLLGSAECERLAERISGFALGRGTTSISIQGWWNGELRWARNNIVSGSDRRRLTIRIVRTDGHSLMSQGSAVTDQLDDESLKAAMRIAEANVKTQEISNPEDLTRVGKVRTLNHPSIWSDSTFNVPEATRAAIAHRAIEGADAKGMLTAGYIEVTGGERHSWNSDNQRWDGYVARTQAQCSMTVRHPKGVGSGWAGISGYDWSAIDGTVISNQALEKCLASLNPVRIEPGRYTVVLEPQAVATLIQVFHRSLDRGTPEQNGAGPWFLGFDSNIGLRRTKLGLKVIDERITISHDPMNPLTGIMPSDAISSTTWIDRGVLVSLVHGESYAVKEMGENDGNWFRDSFYMSGGNTPISEMIATTKRGLYVTRFSNEMELDRRSLLTTGLTRDGLWLIENGKISKSVNNFRFTDSPLFMLNQVEQLGVPVPVFRPSVAQYMMLTPAVVPPIKANDFSLTSLIDAV